MKTARPGPADPSSLRQNAEEILKSKLLEKAPSLNESDIQRLIHELQVRKLELEMQNEELLLAIKAAPEVLLASLLYPAMYISRKDMLVLVANKHAPAMGATTSTSNQPPASCPKSLPT